MMRHDETAWDIMRHYGWNGTVWDSMRHWENRRHHEIWDTKTHHETLRDNMDAMGLYDTAWDTDAIGDIVRQYEHYEALWDTMRYYGRSWDSMTHYETLWMQWAPPACSAGTGLGQSVLSDPGGEVGGREASNTFWCLGSFMLILSFDGTYWVAARSCNWRIQYHLCNTCASRGL